MTDTFEHLKTALADRYTIEHELGAGGMATVYLAHDVKHDRKVAVKVLRPELAAAIGPERFLREIKIAANLTHPHIVPLHDSGEADGFLYYVMPFIDGESLRQLLQREGRLDTGRAVDITAKVGDALSYAPRRNIVHRDIKPENILFSEEHPMVADFGIARAVSTAGGVEMTRTGIALGTPGYMSPEQAAGMRELDARTDVYSLAAVCYEMLVGETPGMWPADEAVKLGRFIDAPPAHRTHLDATGGSIEVALIRALAMRSQDRFANVEAFVAAVTGEGDAGRRYDDDEVRAIVKRAAERQAEHPTEEGQFSLGTVQQIAAGVGLSAERVERAAKELEFREPAEPPTDRGPAEIWLGSATRLESLRIIDGELPQSAYDDLVEEIQATFDVVGQIATLGRSLMWNTVHSGSGGGRVIQVRVTSRGGQTRISVQESVREMAGIVFGGVMGGGGGGGTGMIVGIGVGALGAGPIVGLIAAGWVGGMYLLARKIFRTVTQGKRPELEDLADRLAGIAAGAMHRQVGARPVPRALPE